jgi:hypothetical protein
MTLTITIKMDNAAFFDDSGAPSHGPEAANILRQLAQVCEDCGELSDFHRRLLDTNGNIVGHATTIEWPMTPAEKLQLIRRILETCYTNTESFADDNLGSELAYLCLAITRHDPDSE